MKSLRFTYKMQMFFETPISNHHFTLRCFPPSDGWQTILGENVEIYPNHFICNQTDSFSNHCMYGKAMIPHTHFSVEVSGTAQVFGTNPIELDDGMESVFKFPTKLTQCGANLKAFYEKIIKSPPEEEKCMNLSESFSSLSNFQKAELFMNSLFNAFKYLQGVTGVFTTAEEAFSLGQGVCQDYAHILLALCRKARIPCKYVVGMMIGEGATHAWVEVFEKGKWLSLDPTHKRLADDTYIVLSRGRDAQDCSINQGLFTGGGKQTQKVSVLVEER